MTLNRMDRIQKATGQPDQKVMISLTNQQTHPKNLTSIGYIHNVTIDENGNVFGKATTWIDDDPVIIKVTWCGSKQAWIKHEEECNDNNVGADNE